MMKAPMVRGLDTSGFESFTGKLKRKAWLLCDVTAEDGVLAATPSADQNYRAWIDSDGRTHVTSNPVPSADPFLLPARETKE